MQKLFIFFFEKTALDLRHYSMRRKKHKMPEKTDSVSDRKFELLYKSSLCMKSDPGIQTKELTC